MLYNYLKIAIRNLVRHRTFSLLNGVGLVLGTVCCLYMVLYVQGHYGYDQHHHEAENVYRITTELKIASEGEVIKTARSSPPFAPMLPSEFPEIQSATRVCPPLGVSQQLLQVGEETFYIDPGYYVDSTFFQVFDYNFITGDPETALDEPFSVVISSTLAKKLFGDQPAIGESIAIGDTGESAPFKVGGVFDYEFGNTHLESELYLSMNSGGLGQFVRSNDSWAGNNFLYTYIRLNEHANANKLEAKFPDFLTKYGGEQFRELGMEKKLFLQPITTIHTSAKLSGDFAGNTSSSFLNLMLLIAGFIQLVACINFMNLTTARASRRAQEVGVRKVVGAQRGSLTMQFLTESLLLAVIAVGVAVPLTRLALPYLNELTGADITLFFSGPLLLLLLGMALLTGLLAGLYPALYLSGFKPAKVLKGGQFKGKNWVRQTLVVGQMVLASGLIMGAFIIHSQVNYLLEKDLGFEAEQKLVFNLSGVSNSQQVVAFRNALKSMPEVRQAAAINQPPGQQAVSDILLYKTGQTMDDGDLTLMSYADEYIMETLKIDLLAGRNFTLTDTSAARGIIRVLANEEAIRKQQIPLEEAVGTVLYSDIGDLKIEATIIGVMENVNYQSLADEVQPLILVSTPTADLDYLIADVASSDYTTFLAKAQTNWEQMVPELPFRYTFLDEDIAQLYNTEQTLSSIISTFTILAVIIACLGLFGLSVYAAEQRQKEISIRKILGASVESLVLMLSKEFLLLVGVALLIAVPVAYYFMGQWLDNFAYHTPIYWWIFAGTAGIAISLAFLTISFQSIRAALANPVNALKND